MGRKFRWLISFLFCLFASRLPADSESLAPSSFNLPRCYLSTTNPIVSERKVSCVLRMVYPANQEPGSTNSFSGIVRIHGGVSQGYAKKSYGITLGSPLEVPGLAANPHWVLNAAYIDRSLMRHKLAYDLFKALGATNAPRYAAGSRFVEVFVNGKYNGAYLLMERVDWRLLNLHPFNSNETTHACIYKAVDHSANFSQPGHPGYEQRQPDPLLLPYWGPLDRFDKFVSASPDAEFFDLDRGIASRLDLDNAIDFHLLVLLTCNLDGIDKNFMIARNSSAPGSQPHFFFVPWDYDGTFGRNWDSRPVPPSLWLSNHLFDRLLTNPEYSRKFAARWKQLRSGAFSSEAIQKMIDSNTRTLGDAVARNFTRWPVDQGPYPDEIGFADDINQMKTWTDARIAWLDEHIGQKYSAR